MWTVLALGLSAAVDPELLAVVVIILTRSRPKPLLRACYLASLSMTVACGIAIVAAFHSSHTVAGSSADSLSPATYIIVGGIGLVIGSLAATRRGRELLGPDGPRIHRRHRARSGDAGAGERAKAKAKDALGRGSILAAVVVGAAIGLPGALDLVAFGHIARTGYSTAGAGLAIVAFALVKLVLIEVPILSYAVMPTRTAGWVERFSSWMHDNKIQVIAAVVAVVGLVLVGKGLSSLS